MMLQLDETAYAQAVLDEYTQDNYLGTLPRWLAGVYPGHAICTIMAHSPDSRLRQEVIDYLEDCPIAENRALLDRLAHDSDETVAHRAVQAIENLQQLLKDPNLPSAPAAYPK